MERGRSTIPCYLTEERLSCDYYVKFQTQNLFLLIRSQSQRQTGKTNNVITWWRSPFARRDERVEDVKTSSMTYERDHSNCNNKFLFALIIVIRDFADNVLFSRENNGNQSTEFRSKLSKRNGGVRRLQYNGSLLRKYFQLCWFKNKTNFGKQ